MNNYKKKADAIIKKMTANKQMKENLGDEELRKFNDKINNDNALSYAERAELSAYLSEKLSNIEL